MAEVESATALARQDVSCNFVSKDAPGQRYTAGRDLTLTGAVVGEYLGSSQGVGRLILQAEGTFDINTVMAGIRVLTALALVIERRCGGSRGG